jgi:hypothetical protein
MKKVLNVIVFISCYMLLLSFTAYAKSQVLEVSDEFSDATFWRIMGGVCTLLIFIVSYQVRQRDKLLDKVAGIIFGTEDQPGLKTRIAVIESEISRCEGCNPSFAPHKRVGDKSPHLHVRHPSEED